jgi:hypothetical protein
LTTRFWWQRMPRTVTTCRKEQCDRWDSNPPSGATIRGHRLPGVAAGCKTGLDKPIMVLTVARRFWVLRSGWCQEWCQTVPPTTTVARLVAPGTSSGATTLLRIGSAPRDRPRVATRGKDPTPPRHRRSTHEHMCSECNAPPPAVSASMGQEPKVDVVLVWRCGFRCCSRG